MTREVEERWQLARLTARVTRVWQLGALLTKFVEEGLTHGIDSRESLGWCILEKGRDQLNRLVRRFPENFVKRMRLDLGELVLHVIWIHGPNLVSGGRSEDFDDFNQLIDAGFSREKRLPKHELSHDTSS